MVCAVLWVRAFLAVEEAAGVALRTGRKEAGSSLPSPRNRHVQCTESCSVTHPELGPFILIVIILGQEAGLGAVGSAGVWV